MSFFLEDIDNFLDKASKVRYSNFRVFSYEVGPVREKFSLDKKRYSNCISSAALVDITGFYRDRSGKVESIFSFIKIKKSYNFYNQHKIIKERKTIMIEKQIEDFSIEQIAKSGQCFRIHKEKDGSFSNVAFGKHLRIIHGACEF